MEDGPSTLFIKVLRRNEVDAWDSYSNLGILNISKYCYFDIFSELYYQPTNPVGIVDFLYTTIRDRKFDVDF